MKPAFTNQAPTTNKAPLAVVCAAGSLPFAVADAAIAQGRSVVLFALDGIADKKRVTNYPHRWAAIGRFGSVVSEARKLGCREVVFVGSLVRPPIWKLRLDFKTILMLPGLIASFRGGDNHLLTNVGRYAETLGFRVLGAHEVAPQILIPEGILTKRQPSQHELADIRRGFDFLRATGPFDVGQAAVIASNHIWAMEGIEGTDAVLARIADLRDTGRIAATKGTGVLVKAAKPGQDRRFDLPAVGPKTVEGVVRAGLAGIAVRAGETLAADVEEMVASADRENIFIYGVEATP